MVTYLIVLAIVGFITGAIARALVPGPDHMGILGTILLGLAGSFVGGFIVALVTRPDNSDDLMAPVGILGSVLGAIVLLLIYRKANGRSLTR